jgi:uncharacterized protein (TIGR00725 family)
MTRRLQISVIGAGTCSPELARCAERVGEAIASRGAVLVCGGLGGVMAAAAVGARRRGGLTVGILPSYRAEDANPDIDIVVPTGLGHARNALVAAAADAVIALAGEYGTASEVALALALGRPVVALDAWQTVAGVVAANGPEEAVEAAARLASRSR